MPPRALPIIILAIDDSRSLCAFYRVVLSRFGKVRTAASLAEAWAQTGGVDLIILGRHLVSDAGHLAQVVATLKTIAPVLLSEAPRNEGDNDSRSAIAGVAGHWPRSNDPHPLREQVQRVLGLTQPAAHPPAAVPPAPTFLQQPSRIPPLNQALRFSPRAASAPQSTLEQGNLP